MSEVLIDYNYDPLKWWKENENRYPLIAKLARQYLYIPASSASSERTFSTAGQIVTKKRNCLSAENVNLLVFLSRNRQFLQKNNKEQTNS